MFDFPSVQLPIWLLLIPYGFGIFLFVLYGFFNVYHLLRFATYSFGSYVLVTLFVGGSIIIGALTFSYLGTFDWTVTWDPSNFFNLKSTIGI